MEKRLNVLRWCFALLLLSIADWAFAGREWQMNMYQGVTPLSHDMYFLHMVAMGVCAVIGIVVFGIMIYSIIRHRKSRGYVPATFHDNSRLEIVWSIIPFLILIGLAIPATQVLIRMNDTSDAAVTIKIVGHQWKWEYQYLDQDVHFYSNLSTPYAQLHGKEAKNKWYLLEVDEPLVVPIHKKIRFLVTSTDVIHSWWVPKLGVKRDAVPGFMYEAWATIEKPGVYRGQCAELCGVNHAFMPIVVKAVSEEAFAQWVSAHKAEALKAKQEENTNAKKRLSRTDLMRVGKNKYDLYCAACHQVNGMGIPPLYPALKGSSVAVGHPVSRHISMILDGVPGSAMQPYRDQLTDRDIAAIVTYERNAWENNTDDEIQPVDVAQVRRNQEEQANVYSSGNSIMKKARAGGLR